MLAKQILVQNDLFLREITKEKMNNVFWIRNRAFYSVCYKAAIKKLTTFFFTSLFEITTFRSENNFKKSSTLKNMDFSFCQIRVILLLFVIVENKLTR